MNEGLIIGNRIVRLESCPSTNDYLKSFVAEPKNKLEGLVVVTNDQTKGRGQQGTTWTSEPGMNLCFSIYLEPKLELSRQFCLSQMISLGLVDFLNELGLDEVKIKWPNDIYVGTRKIAGILVENTVQAGKIASSVVGIGLNVNQLNFDASLPNPTSIALESGKTVVDLRHLLSSLLGRIGARYLSLKLSNKLDGLDAEYTELLFQKDVPCNYLVNGELISGVITGVDSSGRLCLHHNSKEDFFDLKEIKFQ